MKSSASRAKQEQERHFPKSIAKMKYFKNFAIFFEVLVLFFVTSDAAVNHVTLGNGIFNVTWKYLSASQEIEFEVRAKAAGYVALGLTKTNSAMQNLDLFVGGVNSGVNYLKDYYATGQSAPPEDSQQDYTLLGASESNGITTVRCKRRLNTQDVKDLQIQPGDKVYFAWAFHTSSDSLKYHSDRNYSPQMHELVPLPPQTTTSSPTTAPTTAPSIAYNKELSFKNGDYLVFWKFDSNTNELFFKLVVKAAGWVGLGISNTASSMENLDIVVAGVNGGQGYIGDYYSLSQTAPPRDTTQNYILISAVENSGTTTVEFKRPINTGDAKDLEIVPGTSYYLACGYHYSNDALSYHNARGYSAQKVVLAEAVPSSSSTYIATTASSTMATPTTSSLAATSMATSTMAKATMTTTSAISTTTSTTATTTSTTATTTSTTATTTSTSATTTSTSATATSTKTTTTSTTATTSTLEATSSMKTTSVIAPTRSTTGVVTPKVTPTTTPRNIVYNKELSFKNGEYLVFWKFDSNTNELFFKLVVKAAGWVGLGMSNTNSGMKELDVVMTGVSGGQGYIGDYYATTTSVPTQDSSPDYHLISANENGGTTTVEFKRNLDTGDAKDLLIKAGESYYLAWAYHSSSDVRSSYHGNSHRGYSGQKVVLVAADAGSTTTARPRPTTSTTQKPVPTTAATMTQCSLVMIILSFFASLLLK